MEIILLEKIENLGKVGDRVAVRPGYARNYLFPKSKALPATAENVAAVEARRAELERAALDFRRDGGYRSGPARDDRRDAGEAPCQAGGGSAA